MARCESAVNVVRYCEPYLHGVWLRLVIRDTFFERKVVFITAQSCDWWYVENEMGKRCFILKILAESLWIMTVGDKAKIDSLQGSVHGRYYSIHFSRLVDPGLMHKWVVDLTSFSHRIKPLREGSKLWFWIHLVTPMVMYMLFLLTRNDWHLLWTSDQVHHLKLASETNFSFESDDHCDRVLSDERIKEVVWLGYWL